MNTYKITLFVLGLDPRLNTRVEYVDAETEEDAEKEVVGDGWGVLKTELMDLDYGDKGFTKDQVDLIEDRVYEVMRDVVPDPRDLDCVVDAMLEDVITDIYETADWSNLEDDEVCLGDIDIAVARIIKNKICNES